MGSTDEYLPSLNPNPFSAVPLTPTTGMELQVECYSGYRADERPRRFSIAAKPDAAKLEVEEVLDQWYGVGYQCFKVMADDGNTYILRHELTKDFWRLDSFRRGEKSSNL